MQGVTPAELARAVPAVTLEEARRVVAQVHRDEDPRTPSSGVRRGSREAVAVAGWVPELEVKETRASRIDPFVKYALTTADGHVVETVRIPLERSGRFSVCVSSQVGCALACAFCATGRLGLLRNLETWEIVEQVRVVRRGLEGGGRASSSERVHGVVFQGMGEPMANLDRVLAAIDVMSDPSALAIDARAITVCTSGLPSGIRRLAREAPKVRLGMSIGSALADTRRHLMPIERSHSLDEAIAAACEHASLTGLAPMWAVTLLAGVNDGVEHAHALADRVARFRDATGRSPRLSIIPYNAIGPAADGAGDPFARADGDREQAFRDALRDRGVFSHRRYSGGADVDAACGQLAARG
ncbi:MAG: 23S rRNA (adenine(2503)-C(2))-methyltransferase RlmN [Labilithrix sp.]|nr:23S rRNA (adenine(2503)-C(2))-methyltransferase RlmN [Labilithrix sp.]MBX3222564.1 23S rRNA (adenine(2503)-C(2))-methyltransferase RlmN [Labilithrix sp.]